MRFSAFHGAVPGSSSQEVANVQGKLVQLGYVLDVNGSYDAATSAAVLNFREKWSLPVKDMIDGALVTALEMAGRPGFNVQPSVLAGIPSWVIGLGAAWAAYKLWRRNS